ncbi:unnamed protein product [Paramecium sonneborni]|uniref:Uncharacterized protein n=1 Tax=Paramecium sonneborni TaxID=65129 RepID=A0A8S1R7G5_9CILI|nr:unnamed protein product [Paramecium sonneborni]CAD8124162.1 unnamed protein product [Paramecium sonneborni]
MQKLEIQKIVGKRIKNSKLEYLALCNQGYVWLSIKLLKYNLRLVAEYEYISLQKQKDIVQNIDNFEIKLTFDQKTEKNQLKEDEEQIDKSFNQINKQDISELEVRRRRRFDQFI